MARKYNQAYYLKHREKFLARHREYRRANPDKRAAGRRRRNQEFREWISSFKAGRPCLDCETKFPPYVMDFDHVRGKKLFDISKARAYSRAAVRREIAKCDLVCANCHRERTQTRL